MLWHPVNSRYRDLVSPIIIHDTGQGQCDLSYIDQSRADWRADRSERAMTRQLEIGFDNRLNSATCYGCGASTLVKVLPVDEECNRIGTTTRNGVWVWTTGVDKWPWPRLLWWKQWADKFDGWCTNVRLVSHCSHRFSCTPELSFFCKSKRYIDTTTFQTAEGLPYNHLLSTIWSMEDMW